MDANLLKKGFDCGWRYHLRGSLRLGEDGGEGIAWFSVGLLKAVSTQLMEWTISSSGISTGMAFSLLDFLGELGVVVGLLEGGVTLGRLGCLTLLSFLWIAFKDILAFPPLVTREWLRGYNEMVDARFMSGYWMDEAAEFMRKLGFKLVISVCLN